MDLVVGVPFVALMLGSFAWLMYSLYVAVFGRPLQARKQRAREAASERHRTHRAATAGQRAAVGPCLLCKATENLPGHCCKYEPRAVRRSHGNRKAMLYRYEEGRNVPDVRQTWERWVGVILKSGADDEDRAFRRCKHGHIYELDAITCAQNLLRSAQVGGALRPSLIPGVDADTWSDIIRRAGGRCYYCRSAVDPAVMHREHAVPLARGGANDSSNIVASCAPCNLRKGTQTAEEFIARHRHKPPYPPPT